MAGLAKVVGERGVDEADDFRASANYTHIQACGPGGIAEADGGFAARFFAFAERTSQITPVG